MNRTEFLRELEDRLKGLPRDVVSDRLEFYSEMIADRIEDGIPEDQAVAEAGNIEDIVNEIISETPITEIIKEKVKGKKRLNGFELTLIILGFPIWFSLLASALAVAVSLYASVWAVIISLWSVFASFVGCVLGGLVLGAVSFCGGELWLGVAGIGISVASAGLSIFSFYGCKALTKGWLVVTKKMFIGLKKLFVKKEAA